MLICKGFIILRNKLKLINLKGEVNLIKENLIKNLEENQENIKDIKDIKFYIDVIFIENQPALKESNYEIRSNARDLLY
jgi:hypothetical protein